MHYLFIALYLIVTVAACVATYYVSRRRAFRESAEILRAETEAALARAVEEAKRREQEKQQLVEGFCAWRPDADDIHRHQTARAAAVMQAEAAVAGDRSAHDQLPTDTGCGSVLSLKPSQFLPATQSPRAIEVPPASTREGHAFVEGMLNSEDEFTTEEKQIIRQAAEQLGDDTVAKLAKDKGQK